VLSRIRQLLLRSSESKTAAIGRRGEKEGERCLRSKGYRVVARNWRAGKDEIDLVCLDGPTLVFVETRTRKSGALVSGYESIGRRKRDALKRVYRAYLAKLRPRPSAFRLDVVEVEHEAGLIIAIRHYENVPLFGKETFRGT
jgi:putative endonuclease